MQLAVTETRHVLRTRLQLKVIPVTETRHRTALQNTVTRTRTGMPFPTCLIKSHDSPQTLINPLSLPVNHRPHPFLCAAVVEQSLPKN
ncbi:hypothetical protein J6590_046032 [Homalodisca vitripennis]|nr:hypothetical protein J6590_046032 [Homalodisca vitripennis]